MPARSSTPWPDRGRWPRPWSGRAATGCWPTHGARRDLGQSLAEGVAELVVEMRRRLPETTAAGPARRAAAARRARRRGAHRQRVLPPSFGRHPRGQRCAELSVVDRLRAAAETDVLVHCCAADPPVDLLYGAGVRGVLVDLDQLGARGLGRHRHRLWKPGCEARRWAPGRLNRSARPPTRWPGGCCAACATSGVDPRRIGQLITHPGLRAGLGHADGGDPALRTLRTAADIVTEQLAS